MLDKVYSDHAARKLFPAYTDDARKRAGSNAPGVRLRAGRAR